MDRALISSSFLALPSEIRNIIYWYTFGDQKVQAAHPSDLNHDVTDEHKTSAVPNVLFTCHQCYREAKLIFYNTVSFSIPLGVYKSCFPWYEVHESLKPALGDNVQHVHRVYLAPHAMRAAFYSTSYFTNLRYLEIDLGNRFIASDQTNFARALKFLKRDDGKSAIVDAIFDSHDPDLAIHVCTLQNLGREKRKFKVVMLWRLEYRFLDFVGEIDLDEWILHVRDPSGRDPRTYDIKQEPLKAGGLLTRAGRVLSLGGPDMLDMIRMVHIAESHDGFRDSSGFPDPGTALSRTHS